MQQGKDRDRKPLIPCARIMSEAAVAAAVVAASSDADAAATTVPTPSPPSFTEMVLLLKNPSKGNNLGSILRCAAASGVRQILTVGYDKCAVQGSHGADKHVQLTAFATAAAAVEACGDDGVIVVGILGALPSGYQEMGYPVVYAKDDDDDKHLAMPVLGMPEADAKPLHHVLGTSYPIQVLSNESHAVSSMIRNARTVCVALSKDRLGLPHELARQCHVFCHVPCVGLRHSPSTPLLDCPTTLTIILHCLAETLGYDEATFQGHKFQVVMSRATAEHKTQLQQDRAKKLRQAALKAEHEESLGGSFWESDEDGVKGDYW